MEASFACSISAAPNSLYTVIHYDRSFSDIRGHWAQDDIELLASKLIAKGKTAARFAPDSAITRAEFAAMLARTIALFGEPGAVKAAPAEQFADYGRISAWARKPIAQLLDANIMKGMSTTSFGPKKPVPQAQSPVALKRMLQYLNKMN
ncbi:S-layer homology domain-containing protein [Paenibacillus sp. J5C_2022]|uniref:S-layer homology domain-containing protein n=1 Tax=Paenibacillus sp. J5C2022 TaxID=2977129 RepID=UPI0021CFD28C|nr:S-layer homology domain-containing protein [Paenibacillus sp. J5C2022]MCU6709987.1 S-layer homology domain-containing protein [Paenibacillus sp. J5C2022]